MATPKPCKVSSTLADASDGIVRARMLVHRRMLTKGKFIDDARKKRSVVPIRFVRACRAGHIGDIDWYSFTHNSETECRRQLWIEERGTSGDIAEIFVRCDCGAVRGLAEAVGFATLALSHCDGNRPWLGPYSRDHCNEPNRLLFRHASNAYFSQIMSVISLPDRNENVREAVETVWDFIAREISWLPAIENRGEGIFIQFSKDAVKNWLARKDVVKRGEILEQGHRIWAEEHKSSKRAFPGLPYILLHSFSHLMITAVSLECGYKPRSLGVPVITGRWQRRRR